MSLPSLLHITPEFSSLLLQEKNLVLKESRTDLVANQRMLSLVMEKMKNWRVNRFVPGRNLILLI